MNEAGIMEGQGLNGLVVGSVNKRVVQKKQPESRAWTFFIECILILVYVDDNLLLLRSLGTVEA